MVSNSCTKITSLPVPGFEDIHSDDPYITAWSEQEVAYIDVLYVPPHMRGQGIGPSLVKEWIGGLDATVKRVKLMAGNLGGCDAIKFWSKLGFVKAYTGELYPEIENTMVLGVNGFSMPVPEAIEKGDDFRHWIEGLEDKEHYNRFPQQRPVSDHSIFINSGT